MGCGVCRHRHFLGTVIGWAAAQTSRYITVSAPTAIHVKTDGSNTNSGCTWDDAKLTIQEGLNTASTEGISEVWVKAGTYEERITLKPSVGLYGGFEGDESALNERPSFPRDTADSYASVIDGQSGGNVVGASTVNTSTTIDGFTVRLGNPCGIYCTGTCTPSIANNTIQECGIGIRFNHSTLTVGWVHHNRIASNGMGIDCYNLSSAVIEDNHVDHNGTTSGNYGIGIRVASLSSPTIERNWIEYNGSSSSGYDVGGICCNGSTPVIRNNVIRQNGGRNGGGLFLTGSGLYGTDVRILSNTIVDNDALLNGGGMYTHSSRAIIANNVVSGNDTGIYRADSTGSVLLRRNCSWNIGYDYDHPLYVPLDYSYDYIQNPNLASDRVHLTASSTWCIDRGWAAYAAGSTDIFGDPRIVNGVVDIGADEYP